MGVLKLTDWFPGNVKPVHVGVYETKSSTFQYWNGKFWGLYMHNIKSAYRMRENKSARQTPTWRGLAEKP